MQGEMQARQNLMSLSQHTNYLSDWSDKIKKRQRQKKSKDIDRCAEDNNFKREGSGRSNLQKWQRRMQSLKKIQYPIINDQLNIQQSFILPKCRVTPKMQSPKVEGKRRDDFNREINRIIEQGLVRKKLQKFKSKNQLLEKNIQRRELKYKPVNLPRSFMVKRQSRQTLHDAVHIRPYQPIKQVGQFKSQLEMQRRKYSMPNLAKVNSNRLES